MERHVLGFWLAGRGAPHRRHGNTDQYQRVLESGIFGALTFCPCLDISSIAPMEHYALRFLACRVVASLSGPTEWLTLKAAISMTTPLLRCACIFEPFPELSSIAPMERYALVLFWLAGRGTRHLQHVGIGQRFQHVRHGNTDQHQRVF